MMNHEKQDNKTMLVTGVINVEYWDQAKFSGVAILGDRQSAPYLGLVFENKIAAENIFKEWKEQYGEKDQYEEIRVSIVLGDIPGECKGYTLHITLNPDNYRMKIKKMGLSIDGTLIAAISRVCRVPAVNYNSVNILKEDFERYLSYYLVPVVVHDNNQYEPLMEYSIEKTELYFRNANEIDENDIDIPVLKRINK